MVRYSIPENRQFGSAGEMTWQFDHVRHRIVWNDPKGQWCPTTKRWSHHFRQWLNHLGHRVGYPAT